MLSAGCREAPPAAPEAPIVPHTTATSSTPPLDVDVRDPAEFAAGYRRGAINLQLGWGQLRLRLADLAAGRPVRLLGKDDQQLAQATAIAASAGVTVVGAELATPPSGAETATLPLLTCAELSQRLGEPDPPLVLDVRTTKEYGKGHIRGAVYAYPNDAAAVVGRLDQQGSYAVVCTEGWRSSTVASMMVAAGFTDVANVIDGMKGWARASLPMLTARDEKGFNLRP
jgi:hydroxyacylglutathione hydrolase